MFMLAKALCWVFYVRLILKIIHRGGLYYPHFTEEKTRTQRYAISCSRQPISFTSRWTLSKYPNEEPGLPTFKWWCCSSSCFPASNCPIPIKSIKCKCICSLLGISDNSFYDDLNNINVMYVLIPYRNALKLKLLTCWKL